MNWILDHIQIVVAIIAAITYMFKRGKPDAEDAAGDPGEDAERSRQIREEIRRKIAERREGGEAPARRSGMGEVTPPVIRPMGRPTLRPVDPFGGPPTNSRPTLGRTEPERPVTPPPVAQPSPAALAAVLERQKKLAEQMQELERARAAELRRAADVAARDAGAAAVASGDTSRAGWLGDLRTAQGLRRAMIQREVLGPPVALR